MAGPSLRSLLSQKSASAGVIREICSAGGAEVCVVDQAGKMLLGELPQGTNGAVQRFPVQAGEAALGHVVGGGAKGEALARLLSYLADRESEQRALAGETLTVYRELHLIEELSEELNALLDLAKIGEAALAQAKKLIPATHGAVLLRNAGEGSLEAAASFGDASDGSSLGPRFLSTESEFVRSVLERGTAEIVNACAKDARAAGAEKNLQALILAPLRAGQSTVGILVLASANEDGAYSAANLKLLNTIALQTATAVRNAMLCAEMVETARARAAYAAELQAASSVQQMLMQGASRPTPGFLVDSVYVPASEVGGDFFFVQPGRDGSLLATIGDVSGKGLTAAMRVSMILGVLRREVSEDPAEILFNLNNALVAQGQLGFTTACSMLIRSSGEFTFSNAGHIAPYLSGVEVSSDAALPLGIMPNQVYAAKPGKMSTKDRIVLMSDGVPEARSQAGDLLGFERLPELTMLAAEELADAARAFGQEDDITVLALKLAS
jgi:serine phosphatase RsbU (regulator of sigma subunit)